MRRCRERRSTSDEDHVWLHAHQFRLRLEAVEKRDGYALGAGDYVHVREDDPIVDDHHAGAYAALFCFAVAVVGEGAYAHDGLADRRVADQRSLDFPEFNAKSTQLDLAIAPPEELVALVADSEEEDPDDNFGNVDPAVAAAKPRRRRTAAASPAPRVRGPRSRRPRGDAWAA